jgi:hypothetical protein
MKKLITMLTVLILFSLKGISQTSNDDTTICIPKIEIQRAINIIETGKIANQELQIIKVKVTELETLIINKDSIISKLKQNIVDYKAIMQKQTTVEHNNNIIINNQIKLQEITTKKLNKQKAKKWITLVLGVTLGFLISK